MMEGMSGVYISVAAIAFVIIFSKKTKANMGIVALAMSVVVGAMLGGMNAKGIIAKFDTNLFLLQFMPILFFSMINESDAFGGVINRIVYASRNRGWLIPLALWAATFMLGFIGVSNYATPAIASPIAFMLSRAAGFPPLLAAYIVCSSSLLAAYMPWNGNTMSLTGIASKYVDEVATKQVLVLVRVVHFTFWIGMFLILYFVLKGYKSKAVEFKKPEPFTKDQKKVLYILAAFLIIIAVPGVLNLLIKGSAFIKWLNRVTDVRLMSMIGAIVLHCMKISDTKTALTKRVPWNSIILIVGMSTFINVIGALGVFDTIGDLINRTIPVSLAPLVFAVIVAVLGAVTAGISTVMPAFAPIAVAFAQSAGLNPIAMLALIMTCPTMASVSPISTGGSLAQLGANEEERQKLFKQQFIICGIQVVVMCILAGLGMHFGLAKLFGFVL